MCDVLEGDVRAAPSRPQWWQKYLMALSPSDKLRTLSFLWMLFLSGEHLGQGCLWLLPWEGFHRERTSSSQAWLCARFVSMEILSKNFQPRDGYRERSMGMVWIN